MRGRSIDSQLPLVSTTRVAWRPMSTRTTDVRVLIAKFSSHWLKYQKFPEARLFCGEATR